METQGLKRACKRDSVALCELLYSLEQRLKRTNDDAETVTLLGFGVGTANDIF